MRIDLLARHWGGPEGGLDGMSVAASFLGWTLCELGHQVRLHSPSSRPPWSHPCARWVPRNPLYTPEDWTADLVITTVSAVWSRTVAAAREVSARGRLVYWHHHGEPPAGQNCLVALPVPSAPLDGYRVTATLPPSSWAIERGGGTGGDAVLVPGIGRTKGGATSLAVAREARDLRFYVLPGRAGPTEIAPWRLQPRAEIAPAPTAPAVFLARAAAVLSPTHAETYGLTLVEAAVRGVPVVCSDLPATRAALGDVATFLPPGAPPAAWLQALREALSAPRRRLQLPPYAEVVAKALEQLTARPQEPPAPPAPTPPTPRTTPAPRERSRTPRPAPPRAALDVSVLLGTVHRPALLRRCVEAARASLASSGLTYEVVVAYGAEDEPALPWLREQADVVPVLGGLEGAIPAFNRAYAATRGALICQLNDDVLVDGDAVARAVRHLDLDPGSAGVVFQFDRGDGAGYRHERLRGALHPNQMVARRSTCEAVVERLGAFWGDVEHRAHKTYGGDSAFGAVCRHLGLRLDSVEGVTCRDLLADDALRVGNAVADDHWSRWNAIYRPMLESQAPATSPDEWPRLYVPRPGRPPRRSPVEAGRPLRLLHLSLAYPGDMQEDLHRQLARIGPTVALPWIGREREALEAARAHRPDLVWAQIQGDNWTAEWVRMLREAAGPNCTLALWTGDVRTSGAEPVERWLVRAGQLFDLVLADSTTYPRKHALDEGVPAACGYLQCGVDPQKNAWDPDALEEGGAVFLGTNYPHLGGDLREPLLAAVEAALPGQLRIYGGGWSHSSLAGIAHPFVPQPEAARIMRRSAVTIAQSLFHDLARYTSDRLKRAACAGAVVAARRFPDMEGLGLVDGENCLAWSTPVELVALLGDWLRPERAIERSAIRARAAALGHERFTQARVVEELLAIVRDHRERRGLP